LRNGAHLGARRVIAISFILTSREQRNKIEVFSNTEGIHSKLVSYDTANFGLSRRTTMKPGHAIAFIFVFGSLALAQANPVPLVNQPLLPFSAAPGSAAFTLTLHGNGFASNAVVNWNGSARLTTFVSSSTLQAAITAADVVKVGTATVTVVNPTPGGGISNPVLFPIEKAFLSPSTALDNAFQGGYAAAILAADINHDGFSDAILAATGTSTGSILYYRGDGHGNFAAPVISTTTIPVEFMRAGDVNGDGNLDLIISDYYSSQTGVLLGDGHGHFRQLRTQSSFAFSAPLALVDLNGDGKLDLIANTFGNPGSINIFLGNGDGTFTPDAAAQINNVFDASNIAVADFNGDGKLDLGIAVPLGYNYGEVQIYLGNGDGTFRAGDLYSTSAESIAAADVNGDGKTDLVAVSYDNGLCVLLGNGDGTFTPGSCIAGSLFGSIQVADFIGNGNLDIATQSYDNAFQYVVVFPGNGDGTFQQPVTLPYSSTSTAGSIGGFSVADFNSDGKLDFLYAGNNPDGPTNVQVLLGSAASISPTTTFEYQNQVGKTSTPQKVVLTNVGNGGLKITGISITGTGAAQFAQQNNCGAGLASGKGCVIQVVFKPTADGTFTAGLSIAYQGAGSPQTIPLQGLGFN
jgi:hypothetical protein